MSFVSVFLRKITLTQCVDTHIIFTLGLQVPVVVFTGLVALCCVGFTIICVSVWFSHVIGRLAMSPVDLKPGSSTDRELEDDGVFSRFVSWLWFCYLVSAGGFCFGFGPDSDSGTDKVKIKLEKFWVWGLCRGGG